MKKLDELIHAVVNANLSALLRRKKSGWVTVESVANEVLADPELGAWVSMLRDDPFELRSVIRRYIVIRVGQLMRNGRYADLGIRKWETVAIPGQRGRRWMPTRGMTIWQWGLAGQAKVKMGSDVLYEGRLLLTMVDVAHEKGYSKDDVVTAAVFDEIVKAAKDKLAA